MRFILSVTAVCAGLAAAALAQTGPPPAKEPAAKAQPEPLKEAATDAFTSCLSQWEKATHMSKREWERACRRVANRLQNLTVK
jgi:regulator of sirC expression with transglutaminase-like and TPR domain